MVDFKKRNPYRDWIKNDVSEQMLATTASPGVWRFGSDRLGLLNELYGPAPGTIRGKTIGTLPSADEEAASDDAAAEHRRDQSKIVDSSVADMLLCDDAQDADNHVIASTTAVNCEVESVSETELVCWVQVTEEAQIKTVFPRSLLGDSMVREGSELVWDTASDTLRRRTFQNVELLKKLEELNKAATLDN